jgi:hypothetical protein
VRHVLPVLILLPAVSAQTPTTDPLDKLVADSPFVPADGARAAPAAGGPLELRGVVFEDGGYLFSLYDQATRESTWVRLGETGQPFVARSFNRERDTLSVEYQGRMIELVLQPAKMATGGQPPPGSPPPLPDAGAGRDQRNNPAPPAPAAQNPTAPPATNAAEAAQAQRLQNIADEIRRRRGNGPQPLPRPKK